MKKIALTKEEEETHILPSLVSDLPTEGGSLSVVDCICVTSFGTVSEIDFRGFDTSVACCCRW
jgi:hypothetical protein